ncbi:UNVERIFIED_CONTAM: hypothetical protein FKN15_001694 [Acipenser sinensis]
MSSPWHSGLTLACRHRLLHRKERVLVRGLPPQGLASEVLVMRSQEVLSMEKKKEPPPRTRLPPPPPKPLADPPPTDKRKTGAINQVLDQDSIFPCKKCGRVFYKASEVLVMRSQEVLSMEKKKEPPPRTRLPPPPPKPRSDPPPTDKRKTVAVNQVQDQDSIFPCKKCGRVFYKVKSRSAHMKSHSEQEKKAAALRQKIAEEEEEKAAVARAEAAQRNGAQEDDSSSSSISSSSSSNTDSEEGEDKDDKDWH